MRTTEPIIPPFPAEYGAAAIADLERAETLYREGEHQAAYDLWQPLAEAGNPEAQFRIGRLHSRGELFPKDPEKAEMFWRAAAAQDHALSLTGLASQRFELVEDRCDPIGLELDKKAALLGSLLSQYRQGRANSRFRNCYGYNSHVALYWALYWFSQAANQGESFSADYIVMLSNLREGSQKSKNNIYYYFLISSEKKNVIWPLGYDLKVLGIRGSNVSAAVNKYNQWRPKLVLRLP